MSLFCWAIYSLNFDICPLCGGFYVPLPSVLLTIVPYHQKMKGVCELSPADEIFSFVR